MRPAQFSTKLSLGPECSHKLSSSAELLDSFIRTVRHQEVVVPVVRHSAGTIELPIPSPLLSKREQEPPLSVEPLNIVIFLIAHTIRWLSLSKCIRQLKVAGLPRKRGRENTTVKLTKQISDCIISTGGSASKERQDNAKGVFEKRRSKILTLSLPRVINLQFPL